uniref:Uncharacterized protein n=1 Tax=Anopheles darlingi TaxID=43151 RepID=A0A2M4CY25_ANODA
MIAVPPFAINDFWHQKQLLQFRLSSVSSAASFSIVCRSVSCCCCCCCCFSASIVPSSSSSSFESSSTITTLLATVERCCCLCCCSSFLWCRERDSEALRLSSALSSAISSLAVC